MRRTIRDKQHTMNDSLATGSIGMFPIPIKREFQPHNNNIINLQEVTPPGIGFLENAPSPLTREPGPYECNNLFASSLDFLVPRREDRGPVVRQLRSPLPDGWGERSPFPSVGSPPPVCRIRFYVRYCWMKGPYAPENFTGARPSEMDHSQGNNGRKHYRRRRRTWKSTR
jgi:hypothetical protein